MTITKQTEATDLEETYEKNRGSGSGTEIGYTVEAKYDYLCPAEISGQLFDNRWRAVNFEKSKIGVPSCAPSYQRHLLENGLLSFSAAQALRWWFIAEVEASNHGFSLCWATRLIEHRVTFSHKVEAIGQIG